MRCATFESELNGRLLPPDEYQNISMNVGWFFVLFVRCALCYVQPNVGYQFTRMCYMEEQPIGNVSPLCDQHVDDDECLR